MVYVHRSAFQVTAGEEHLRRFKFREFCVNCGSRIANHVDHLGIGFFPALLSEEIQHDLPDIFRANKHHLAEETVLTQAALHELL